MINIFQLADNDQSVFFLGEIFGNVGMALSGTGPALLSIMFKVFNTALLSLGAILVTYVTVVGVMATAQEGEFMGKKWNSLWVPLRTIAGIAALMPTGSGYCAAQVIIMWLIVQGVGAADQVWKAAVDTIGQGGAIQTISPGASDDVGRIAPGAVSDLFSSLVCQSAATKLNAGQGGDENVVARSTYDGNDSQYNFGLNGNAVCGSIGWGNPTLGANAAVAGQALQQLVPQLEIIADHYVRAVIDDPNCWTTQDPAGNQCTQVPPPGQPNDCVYFKKYYGENFGNSSCMLNNANAGWSNVLSYAGSNFILDSSRLIYGFAANASVNAASVNSSGNVSGAGNISGTNISSLGGNSNLQRAEANGWIYAGSYYYSFANTNNGVSDNFQNVLNVFTNHVNHDYQIGPTFVTQKAAGSISITNSSGSFDPNVLAFYCGPNKPETQCPSPLGGAIALAQEAVTAMSSSQNVGGGGIATAGGGGPLSSGALGIISMWMGVLAPSSGSATNPIITIQHFGKGCLIAAETMFWVGLALVALVGLGSTIVVELGNTVNYASGVAQVTAEVLIPAMFSLIGMLITIGALLGVYTPLVPYMLFTFGAIGWFIASIEAMVAAPLIALGMLSPAGQHEILGRAEPAVMILMNIFLRPTLMVIGMIAGMLLSYVVIEFINAAFLNVVANITSSVGLIEGFIYIMAYAGLVITALNKCFALIHILPDRVLRFIGGQPESYGEAEALEQVKGKVSAGGQVAGQATSGAASSLGKGIKGERTRRAISAKQKEQDASLKEQQEAAAAAAKKNQ